MAEMPPAGRYSKDKKNVHFSAGAEHYGAETGGYSACTSVVRIMSYIGSPPLPPAERLLFFFTNLQRICPFSVRLIDSMSAWSRKLSQL